MEHFGRLRDVRHKGVVDLLTEADEAAERLIDARLRDAFPDDGLLAEEGGSRPGGPYQWIVDPIDGTTNFVQSAPLSVVSIGVAFRGEVVVGVIYDPYRNELFSAVRGQGAK